MHFPNNPSSGLAKHIPQKSTAVSFEAHNHFFFSYHRWACFFFLAFPFSLSGAWGNTVVEKESPTGWLGFVCFGQYYPFFLY